MLLKNRYFLKFIAFTALGGGYLLFSRFMYPDIQESGSSIFDYGDELTLMSQCEGLELGMGLNLVKSQLTASNRELSSSNDNTEKVILWVSDGKRDTVVPGPVNCVVKFDSKNKLIYRFINK